MSTMDVLRRRRLTSGFLAATIAQKAKMERTRLVALEYGQHSPSEMELERIARALRVLIKQKTAAEKAEATPEIRHLRPGVRPRRQARE